MTIPYGPGGFRVGPTSQAQYGDVQGAWATAAEFVQVNPVLPLGMLGFESDTGRFKIGDGVSDWNTLSYWRLDTTRDVIVDDATKGLVLKSPDGHYWRVLVDNAGALSQTDLGTTKPA